MPHDGEGKGNGSGSDRDDDERKGVKTFKLPDGQRIELPDWLGSALGETLLRPDAVRLRRGVAYDGKEEGRQ